MYSNMQWASCNYNGTWVLHGQVWFPEVSTVTCGMLLTAVTAFAHALQRKTSQTLSWPPSCEVPGAHDAYAWQHAKLSGSGLTVFPALHTSVLAACSINRCCTSVRRQPHNGHRLMAIVLPHTHCAFANHCQALFVGCGLALAPPSVCENLPPVKQSQPVLVSLALTSTFT